MVARTFRLLLGALLLTASATAQAQGIRGVVRDVNGRPLGGAEVSVGETASRARTDSLGRYALPRVAAGPTPLRVRLITYNAFDTSVVVPTSGWADVSIVMARVAPTLAEVRARGMQNQCDPTTLDGFDCRRQAGVGYYRGPAELKALNGQQFLALFYGFPGIRPRLDRSRYGDNWRPAVRPSRCFAELVNGRPEDPYRPIASWRPDDIVAVEYYDEYRKIPLAFRQHMDGICDLAVYWLYNARRGDRPPSIAEQLAAIAVPTSNDVYDAIVLLLRRSPAKGETRFVPAGQRITVDFAGLDTALGTLGLERSPSRAAIETRYPDMTFGSDGFAPPCAVRTDDSQCPLAPGATAVRFDTPRSEGKEKLSFRMIVTDRVGSRADVSTVSTHYDVTLERRDGEWRLANAEKVNVP